MTGGSRAPRPELLHIATFLRAELDRREWNVKAFNEAMGYVRTATNIYPWLNATGVPNADAVRRMTNLFGVPAETFAPKDPVTMSNYEDQPQNNIVSWRRATVANNPLQFSVSPDGTARLQLDVTGQIESMSALLRMILDQNVMNK